MVQVNTWGGTTKEFEVEVDLHKLDAYNITLPQVISAVGNANINVGGRTINFGQQSVNISTLTVEALAAPDARPPHKGLGCQESRNDFCKNRRF